MDTFSYRERSLAGAYAFIAGFVDSVGFIFLGGVFLSFMSGNTTRAATALVGGDLELSLLAGSCLLLFLGGVMEGAFVRRVAKRYLALHWVRDVVIANMDLLFMLASLLLLLQHPYAAVMVASVAIGAMNSIFERDGEVAIALTYMTGTLVKMGQRFIDSFFGGSHRAWLQHLLMWACLTAGAVAGAFSFMLFDVGSLHLATIMCLCVTAVVMGNRGMQLWRSRTSAKSVRG